MLVIFDCDGVLVDSESLAAEVFSACLTDAGFQMTASECECHFYGKTLEDCFAWLERHFGKALPGNFKEKLDLATKEAFSRELRHVSFVDEVLAFLRKNSIPMCVASNGGYLKTLNSLSVVGFDSYFKHHCFSAEQVKRGKPAPDLFLYAAESMGVPAEFCTVVEDSPLGVKAAVDAGMRVFYFQPQAKAIQQEAIQEAINDQRVCVFNRMEELIPLFKVNSVAIEEC